MVCISLITAEKLENFQNISMISSHSKRMEGSGGGAERKHGDDWGRAIKKD